MSTVCHDYIFLAVEVSVYSGPFSLLVCIPGIQRSFAVPVLLGSSQLPCFVVLLINNYIMYCCTVLNPWHINSVLNYLWHINLLWSRSHFSWAWFRIYILVLFSSSWLSKSPDFRGVPAVSFKRILYSLKSLVLGCQTWNKDRQLWM